MGIAIETREQAFALGLCGLENAQSTACSAVRAVNSLRRSRHSGAISYVVEILRKTARSILVAIQNSVADKTCLRRILLFGGVRENQDSKVGTSGRHRRSVVRDHWQSL
jgi:hypothetical protein